MLRIKDEANRFYTSDHFPMRGDEKRLEKLYADKHKPSSNSPPPYRFKNCKAVGNMTAID